MFVGYWPYILQLSKSKLKCHIDCSSREPTKLHNPNRVRMIINENNIKQNTTAFQHQPFTSCLSYTEMISLLVSARIFILVHLSVFVCGCGVAGAQLSQVQLDHCTDGAAQVFGPVCPNVTSRLLCWDVRLSSCRDISHVSLTHSPVIHSPTETSEL